MRLISPCCSLNNNFKYKEYVNVNVNVINLLYVSQKYERKYPKPFQNVELSITQFLVILFFLINLFRFENRYNIHLDCCV